MKLVLTEITINKILVKLNLIFLILIADGLIFLGMILLIESGNQTDHKKSRIMCITGLTLVVVFFSFLLSVFRSKAQGYPYR